MHTLANDLNVQYQRPVQAMQAQLTLGFYVLGDAHDLPGIFEYCDAVPLKVQGSWRSVAVPPARASALIKILGLVPAVENIHGFTEQGRVPLRDYLRGRGIFD